MTSTDLAWAAGFIDGEGSIGVHRENVNREGRPHRQNYRASLQVANTQRAACDRLQKVFGVGEVMEIRPTTLFRARQFRYTLRNRLELFRVLFLLRPYLFLKAEQADLTLAFLASRQSARGVGRYAPYTDLERDIHRQLRELNTRGPGRKAVIA